MPKRAVSANSYYYDYRGTSAIDNQDPNYDIYSESSLPNINAGRYRVAYISALTVSQLLFLIIMSLIIGTTFNAPINIKNERKLRKWADLFAALSFILLMMSIFRIFIMLIQTQSLIVSIITTIFFFVMSFPLWLPQFLWWNGAYRKSKTNRNFIVFVCNWTYALVAMIVVLKPINNFILKSLQSNTARRRSLSQGL